MLTFSALSTTASGGGRPSAAVTSSCRRCSSSSVPNKLRSPVVRVNHVPRPVVAVAKVLPVSLLPLVFHRCLRVGAHVVVVVILRDFFGGIFDHHGTAAHSVC